MYYAFALHLNLKRTNSHPMKGKDSVTEVHLQYKDEMLFDGWFPCSDRSNFFRPKFQPMIEFTLALLKLNTLNSVYISLAD